MFVFILCSLPWASPCTWSSHFQWFLCFVLAARRWNLDNEKHTKSSAWGECSTYGETMPRPTTPTEKTTPVENESNLHQASPRVSKVCIQICFSFFSTNSFKSSHCINVKHSLFLQIEDDVNCNEELIYAIESLIWGGCLLVLGLLLHLSSNACFASSTRSFISLWTWNSIEWALPVGTLSIFQLQSVRCDLPSNLFIVRVFDRNQEWRELPLEPLLE